MQPGLCGPEQLLLSVRPGPALKPLQDRRWTAGAPCWTGSCDRTATFPGDPGPDHFWGDLHPGGQRLGLFGMVTGLKISKSLGQHRRSSVCF